jgi:hypothetical protein
MKGSPVRIRASALDGGLALTVSVCASPPPRERVPDARAYECVGLARLAIAGEIRLDLLD